MKTGLILILLTVLCLLFLAAPFAWAERATEAEMRQVCENWLAYMVSQRGSWAGDIRPQIVGVQEIVVNQTVLARCYSIAPRGYVVVPVLKELPPVTACSEDYGLDVTEDAGVPQLLKDVLTAKAKLWTETYGSLDAPLPRTGKVLFGPEGREEWNRYVVTGDRFVRQLGEGAFAPLTEAGPLLTSAWHQGAPYNNDCPMGDGGTSVVGCVATAAAQIMHYWQYPPSGTGSDTDHWDGDQSCGGNAGGGNLAVNFGSHTYDWANMPDDCSGGCNATEEAALAQLCYDLGVAFDMDYGYCSSGAWTYDALTVYPDHFGYDPSIDRQNRSDHTVDGWFDIIKPQINASQPMQYRIYGHSIVCDGWRDTGGIKQYHMNYGWADGATTWYTIDNLLCNWAGCDTDVEFLIRNIIPGNRPPVAVCHDDTVFAGVNCDANASIDNGSSDPDGDTITLSQSPAGPYPLGTTAVTLTVTDEHGLSATCTANVTVRDVTPPTVQCPTDITVECMGYCGTPSDDAQLAPFFAAFSATDYCDNSLDLTDDRPACFPTGPTTVTFRATDDAGNWASCTAVVSVVDRVPPVITCPADITVECSDHCGTPSDDPQLAGFFAAVSASDVCDDTLDMTDNRQACFSEGTTNVTFTATDDAGNAASCTARVTVEDTTPPDITVSLNRDALWPPNHKMADIVATVEVTDICDPDPTFVLTSITSNEPENGLGDGDTPDDIQGETIGTPDLEFRLRSERAGGGNGRVYTITYMASDHSGNTAVATATVRVPHDQSARSLASLGYGPDGRSFDPASERFALVIPSQPARYSTDGSGNRALVAGAFDATRIDVTRAYVGNLMGVITPVDNVKIDANEDGLTDLALWYSVADAEALLGNTVTSVDNRWLNVAYDPEAPDAPPNAADPLAPFGPVGLHYFGPDPDPLLAAYLVPNIFQLGSPVPLEVALPTNPAGVDGQPGMGALLVAYPNPSAPSVTVSYSLVAEGQATLQVYNARGGLVRTLEDNVLAAGPHLAVWDGRDVKGQQVAPGVYFVRLSAGAHHATQKILLVK